MSEENKQRLKEYQKNYLKVKKNQHKNILSFFLFCIRTEQKILIFDKQCLNKNAFHKNKKPVSIDKVDIKEDSVV